MIKLATPEDTFDWGRQLASEFRAGDVVALCGNLGAGKTHLAKGIVAGLGSSADVSSPTFSLIHEYLDGRFPVFHFDFYRLEHPAEVLQIGWDEILEEDGVVVVEWADRFPELLPERTRWFEMKSGDGGARELEETGGPSV